MKQFVFYLAERFHRIVVFYIVSILLAATLLMWLEQKSFDLMVWYSCVTALTIGYGDVTAVTTGGRIVTMLFAHLWIFGVAPLVIANVLNALIENRDRFSHEEQEEIKRQLQFITQALVVLQKDYNHDQTNYASHTDSCSSRPCGLRIGS